MTEKVETAMTTYTWKSAVSADWSVAADWTPAGPPNAATADVGIAATGGYTVTIASGESFLVDSLSFAPPSASLLLSGTLSLGGTQAAMAVGSGTVKLAGGTIVGGIITMTGGTLAGTAGGTISSALVVNAGTVSAATGTTLTLAGMTTLTGGALVKGGGTLATTGTTSITGNAELDGSLVWSNSGTVLAGAQIYADYPSGSGKITLNNSGAFDLTTDGPAFYINGSGTLVFNNAGVLAKTGGTGTSSVSIAIGNTGTITATSGALELDGGGALAGTIGATGAGTLVLGGGTFSLSGATQTITGPLTMASAVVSIASGKTLTLSGAVALTGGTELAGTGTLATSGSTTLSGNPTDLDSGLSWINSGTVLDGANIYYDSLTPTSATSFSIANQANSVFNFTTDGFYAFYNDGSSAATATFANAGLLEKTAGTSVVNFDAVLNNTGSIAVNSGTLELDGGGTLGGTTTINTAGALAFGGATITLTGSISNGGKVALANANVVVASSGTIGGAGALTLNAATVTIASGKTLTLSGPVTWSGSEVAGPGTLTTTGVTTINGNPADLDSGLGWVNGGTVLVGSNIYYDGYSTTSTSNISVTNQAAGVFNFTSDGFYAFFNDGSSAAVATFANAGLLEKTAGTSVVYFDAALSNSGSVAVTSGTLELDGGGTLGGTATIGVSGALALGGTNITLTGSISNSGTLAFSSGATLNGSIANAGTVTLLSATVGVVNSETIGGAVTLSGGSVTIASGNTFTLSGPATWTSGTEVSGPGTLATSGVTTINGSPADLDSGLAWVNSGTVLDGGNIYYDTYSASSSSNLSVTNQAAGVFNFTSDGFYAFYNDGANFATTTFTNAGLLEKTAGTATGMIYFEAALNSTGTVTATKGTLQLAGGGTLGGSIGGSGGGLVQLSSSKFVTTGTAAILDAGTSNALQLANAGTWNVSGVINDGGRFSLGNNSGVVTLAVASGASFNFTTDDGSIVTGGTNTLTNAGIIAKTGGTGTSSIGVSFTNSGTVDAASGTLKLAATVAGAGRLQIEAGKTLELASGAVAGSNTIDFNGPGATLRLDVNTSAPSKPILGLGAGSIIYLPADTSSTVAVISGTTLTITPSGGSALKFVSASSLAGIVPVVVTSPASGTFVTLYALAAATPHTPEPVAFGSVHVGDTDAQALTIGNTGPTGSYTENLDAQLTSSATGFTAAGTFTGLGGGGTNNTSLTVTLNTANPGTIAGTGTLTLQSDGTGVDGRGQLALPTQTVNVSGAVYAYAAPVLSVNTINLGAMRVANGASLTGSVTLADGTTATQYQESLVYQLGTAPAALSVGNAAGTLVAGGTVAIGVTLSAATAGDFTGTQLGSGGAGASFVSAGAGTSGLADTPLTAPTLTVNGQVFATAIAQVGSTNVNFGIVHVGDVVNAVTIGVTNGASGALTDLLTPGTTSEAGSYTGAVTEAFGGGVAGGASGTVSFGLSTASAGVQTGTVNLNFFSHDSVLTDLALAALPVTVTGTVDNYATAAIKVLSGQTLTGAGNAYAINLGTIAMGGTASPITLDIANTATGPADNLAGSFNFANTTGFTNGGFVSFSGLAAGQASASDVITLSTANVGTFTETVTLSPAGSNANFSAPLAPVTLTVTGIINNPGTIGPTFTLTPMPTTLNPAAGTDTFIAINGALNARDSITGGSSGGLNTLDLSGAGVFDLQAPKVLANIQIVNASDTQPGIGQTVFLRDALNVTLNVASLATPNPGGITIYGGNDSSIINLGTGTDTVVLGSAKEVVNGGGGTALVQATTAFAGAAVEGTAAGQTTLEITNAGTATITLNASTTYATVQLDAANVLALNKMGFITGIAEAANSTITAGAAKQTLESVAGGSTLNGYSGFGDLFLGTSAGLNGDTISHFGGAGTLAEKIDITDLAPTASLTYTGTTTQGTLMLSDGTHSASITMIGNYSQSHFHPLVSDGHTGSFVTYS
jgi:hypothetical protein